MTLLVYILLLWLGIGFILARDVMTETRTVFLKDLYDFAVFSLIAPAVAVAGMVMGLYDRRGTIVVFKQKEN